jgi:hypothetical protein
MEDHSYFLFALFAFNCINCLDECVDCSVSRLNLLERVVDHIPQLLPSFSIGGVSICELLIALLSFIQLPFSQVEVSNFFNNFRVFESHQESFFKAQVRLDSSLLPIVETKDGHVSPHIRIRVVQNVGLGKSIFGLHELP